MDFTYLYDESLPDFTDFTGGRVFTEHEVYADIGRPEDWSHRDGGYQPVSRTADQAAEIAQLLDACLKWDGRIRRIQLDDHDNAYNTYTHEGLPPGPISNPGRAALEAVMAPDHTAYLYFVAKNDGTHYFSKTVAEHNAAVVKYQRGGKPLAQ